MVRILFLYKLSSGIWIFKRSASKDKEVIDKHLPYTTAPNDAYTEVKHGLAMIGVVLVVHYTRLRQSEAYDGLTDEGLGNL